MHLGINLAPSQASRGEHFFSLGLIYEVFFWGKIFTPEPDADVVSTGSAAQELIWLPPTQAPQAPHNRHNRQGRLETKEAPT